ncbi:PPOX class F420-dependent oxidoreductase [Intrasporangium mesophilum]
MDSIPTDLDVVAAHQYVSLTTFRRSGEPVATPVWIARDGDDLVVITVDHQGKTKRLAHTARVELRPCDIRGVVPADAPVYSGTGRLDRTPEGVAAVKRAMSAKYVTARLGNGLERLLGPLMRRKPRAGIRITLDGEPRSTS